jgi:hypothetical protein
MFVSLYVHSLNLVLKLLSIRERSVGYVVFALLIFRGDGMFMYRDTTVLDCGVYRVQFTPSITYHLIQLSLCWARHTLPLFTYVS